MPFAVEGFAAHKRQGCGNNATMTQAIIHGAGTQAFIEDIAECIDINREFLVQIARQKTEVFSRLYRWSRQDNPFDTSGLECLCRQRTRAITFTGTGRADAECQCVILDSGDVLLLGVILGAKRLGRARGGVCGFDLLGAGFDLDDVVVVSLLS